MASKIQIKRGLQINLPALDVGELGFTTDQKRTYIGSSSGNVELAKQSDVAAQLADKASRSEVDTKVAAVASGAPKGVYATHAALQAAFPTGNSNIYLVTADGKWYYWSGSAWTAGGTYQATGISEGAVTLTELNNKQVEIEKIVKGVPSKNLFNRNNVKTGFFVNYGNGNLAANANYSASDYIDVTGTDKIFVTGTTEQLAFYDSNKQWISGSQYNVSPLTVPANAQYVRISMQNTQVANVQVEKGDRFTGYESFGGQIPEIRREITITVKPDGTGNFTNVKAAIDSVLGASDKKRYIIEIYEGSYNIKSYYTSEQWNAAGFRGLFVPDWCTLRGVGNKDNIVLYADNSPTKMQLVSTLHLSNTATLENLTVNANYLRYAVHDDFATAGQVGGYDRIVRNCTFSNANGYYAQAYGAGTQSGARFRFENCKFISDKPDSIFTPFSIHNNVNFLESDHIKFINCDFASPSPYGARFGSLGSGNKSFVEFIGCNIKGIYLMEEQANGVGIDYVVTGYGNTKEKYRIDTTDGKQYTYNFREEVAIKRNVTSSIIPKGKPVMMSGSGVQPCVNESLFYGVAFKDIAVNGHGEVKTSGYIRLSDIGVTGAVQGDNLVISGGVITVNNTSTKTVGVCIDTEFAKLK